MQGFKFTQKIKNKYFLRQILLVSKLRCKCKEWQLFISQRENKKALDISRIFYDRKCIYFLFIQYVDGKNSCSTRKKEKRGQTVVRISLAFVGQQTSALKRTAVNSLLEVLRGHYSYISNFRVFGVENTSERQIPWFMS